MSSNFAPGDKVEVFALDSIPQRLLWQTVEIVQVHRTMATIRHLGQHEYRVPLRVLRAPR